VSSADISSLADCSARRKPAELQRIKPNMNKAQPGRDPVNASSSGVVQILRDFFQMAVEEWWKLVADVIHAFGGKPYQSADAIDEKRFGDQ
jgi:hypothetical protein